MKQGWITGLEDIACYMNICRDTLLAWMQKYEMPIVKIGGKWCVIISEIDKWMLYPYEKRPQKPTSKIPPQIPT